MAQVVLDWSSNSNFLLKNETGHLVGVLILVRTYPGHQAVCQLPHLAMLEIPLNMVSRYRSKQKQSSRLGTKGCLGMCTYFQTHVHICMPCVSLTNIHNVIHIHCIPARYCMRKHTYVERIPV